MSEISVSKVLESLFELSAKISASYEAIANMKTHFSSASDSAKTLAGYNGAIKEITYKQDEDTITTLTEKWIINVPENLQNASQNINAKLDEMVEDFEKLNSNISDSEMVATYVENQINELGKNLSTTDLAAAFMHYLQVLH